MKKLKFILAVSISLLFSGCANNQSSTEQFTFYPGSKGLKFVEGKPYMVPYGSVTNNQAFKSSKDKQLIFAQKVGADCKKGDVLWFESNAAIKGINAQRNKNLELMKSIWVKSFNTNRAGCAHPLSKMEYQYYMEQRRQQISNARYKQQQQQYQRQQEQQEYDNTMASLNQQTANMASYINSQNNSGSYNQKTNNLQHTWLRDINGNMYSLYGY